MLIFFRIANSGSKIKIRKSPHKGKENAQKGRKAKRTTEDEHGLSKSQGGENEDCCLA
jgi:hypothetical protein